MRFYLNPAWQTAKGAHYGVQNDAYDTHWRISRKLLAPLSTRLGGPRTLLIREMRTYDFFQPEAKPCPS